MFICCFPSLSSVFWRDKEGKQRSFVACGAFSTIKSQAFTAVTQAISFSGNLEQQGKQVNKTHVIETCRVALA